jgi:hypothetical protein
MGCTGSSRAKGDGKDANLFTSNCKVGVSLALLKEVIFWQGCCFVLANVA